MDRYARNPLWRSSGFSAFPAILRTNKLIHEEACEVLYGENTFRWFITGYASRRMWRVLNARVPSIPEHYSRRITTICLLVFVPSSKEYPWEDAISSTREIRRGVCSVLAPNGFRLCKVNYHCYTYEDPYNDDWGFIFNQDKAYM